MLRPLPALLVLFSVLVVACGGGGGGGVGSATTPTPQATLSDDSVCLPGESTPVVAACEDLVGRLSVSRGDVELVSERAVEWADACLGAPEPGEACAEVITPGFEVVLRAAGEPGVYTYHTDEGSAVRLANIELNPPDTTQVELGTPERVVSAEQPVAFDFAPDGRLFFTERQLGQIRTVDLASGAEALFAEVDIYYGSECGLLGIAIDPEFASNGYVYVYVTQPVPGREDVGKPRVLRFTDTDGVGTATKRIVDDLPLTNSTDCAHVGGNLHFGPDGYLYLSLGNFERPPVAGNLNNPLGSILRIDKSDGSAPADNPFAGEPRADARVFAHGFRNPWDFAFNPATGNIYASENGPGNCDELNLVLPGADYGAPDSIISGDAPSCFGLGGVDPIYLFSIPSRPPEQFASNAAPAGVAFVGGDVYPDLGDGLLVCEFLTSNLRHLHFTGAAQDEVDRDVIVGNDCQFNVETGPDGLIYYSNAGGIYRLPPG